MADGPTGIQRSRIDSRYSCFYFVAVGHESALKIIRAAGNISDAIGNAAAGSGFNGAYSHELPRFVVNLPDQPGYLDFRPFHTMLPVIEWLMQAF
jgi:hypothetical protein